MSHTKEPVAYRLTNTSYKKPRFEYFDNKTSADCRQAEFNMSVDDGGLYNLTPLYSQEHVEQLERESSACDMVADLTKQRDELASKCETLETALAESRANDIAAMGWLADCRFAVGDNGKRMLQEFVDYLREMKKQRDELLAALEKMNRAYVGLMENGRDRIIMLGGDCDQVDVMERNDPNLCEIRATIASVKSDQFRDATKMADETSVPAIVFYPAGSLGEEVYSEGGLA